MTTRLEPIALYTDLYELTMAQGYFKEGKSEQRATFDYFYRTPPFGGGYVVFCGLATLVEILEDFRFGNDAIAFLREQGFEDGFLERLKTFRFEAEVRAPAEGELIFPYAPALQVRGTLLEAQLVETLLLNLLNFQSLIATKAARMRQVAGDRTLVDFGLRRAHSFGGLHASRAAVVGGFDATSNVLAGMHYDIPLSGTQAHAWIQSFEREIDAFRAFARQYGDASVLLVDTYDTLKSGVPNAITIAGELRDRGQSLRAIRLDSGDLAYLARHARAMLDEAGFPEVKIAASNNLDEHVIRSLLIDQDAPIDIFGVGTQLVTAHDDPALGGVYKLATLNGTPRIKLSDSLRKMTFPGDKQVFRIRDAQGQLYADAVALDEQTHIDRIHHPHEPHKETQVGHLEQTPLLKPVMREGRRIAELPSAFAASTYAREQLAALPAEHRRFKNPHIYKVGLSTALRDRRDEAVAQAHRRIPSNPS
ncbi:nicotinate phosphoribosyltransferase [Lujinxingia vulgaris]|uniref:Nicotinate phosphoribosyltransferase n=1 Tax=Lujinxingia vulgaris TaxID=2600176 RepID=A0A5C6WZI1_9DELT|nr:nicotinate phosphoribosyltransferase [Lujinxingia vulgaris]TXD31811.1 nicotinate phosphoribosyltransferase [Lujinxingia vulgaris]